jgi:hypothetical protein
MTAFLSPTNKALRKKVNYQGSFWKEAPDENLTFQSFGQLSDDIGRRCKLSASAVSVVMRMAAWASDDDVDQIPCTQRLRGDPGLALLAFYMEMDEDEAGVVGCFASADVRDHSQTDPRDLDSNPACPPVSLVMVLPLCTLRTLEAGG